MYRKYEKMIADNKIEFVVLTNGISPSTVVPAGVQGDDKAIMLVFDVSALELDLSDRLRIDVENGVGGFYSSTELLRVNNKVSFELPFDVTRFGGIAKLFLIVSSFSEGVEQKIKYSLPARICFESSAVETTGYDKVNKSLTGIVYECEKLVDNAKQSEQNALESANNAAEYELNAREYMINAENSANRIENMLIPQNFDVQLNVEKTVSSDRISGQIYADWNNVRCCWILNYAQALELESGKYYVAISRDFTNKTAVIMPFIDNNYVYVASFNVSGKTIENVCTNGDEYIIDMIKRTNNAVAIVEHSLDSKANLDDVVNRIESSKNEMLSKTVAKITNSKTGKSIVRADMCDERCPMNVTIYGDAEHGTTAVNPVLKMYGKNLLNITRSEGSGVLMNKSTIRVVNPTSLVKSSLTPISLPAGKYTVSATVSGSISYSSGANKIWSVGFKLNDDTKMTLFNNFESGIQTEKFTVDIAEGDTFAFHQIYFRSLPEACNITVNIMVEAGANATEFEEFRDAVTFSAGQTILPDENVSLSVIPYTPASTLIFSDNAGADCAIKTDYTQNLQLVIADIYDKLAK